MTWVEGDYWLLTLDLPAGEHEFKVAAAHSGGGCSADWESGPNRVVQASGWRKAASGGHQQPAGGLRAYASPVGLNGLHGLALHG